MSFAPKCRSLGNASRTSMSAYARFRCFIFLPAAPGVFDDESLSETCSASVELTTLAPAVVELVTVILLVEFDETG